MKQEMEYIYEIYRQGNIMKAADKLFISQPALSMALRRTEEELGVRLFDRGTRPMRLTEAGRIYIRAIEKMQVLEHELDDRLSDLSELRSGVLRIGGSHYINSCILAPVLTRFHERYPGIRIEITEDSSAALSELLREHKIDLTSTAEIAADAKTKTRIIVSTKQQRYVFQTVMTARRTFAF